MKNIILFLTIIAIIESNYAQTPEFETTFYFEDAVGNKDSVVVGYDPSVPGYTSGKPNGFDPQFGEIPKQEPFDTILDVRIDPSRHGWEPLFFYKRMIGFCEKLLPSKACYGGTSGGFVISNKYPPLKISYSQKAFGIPNNSGSFMTNNKFFDLVGPQALESWNYFCLSDTGEHTIDFSDSAYVTEYWPLKKGNVPMKGDYLAYLPQINFYIGGGECLFHTSTTDQKIKALQAYPVPTQDILIIELPEKRNFVDENIVIYDLLGRAQKVLTTQADDQILQLDVNQYDPGYYFGIIANEYLFKFIKN